MVRRKKKKEEKINKKQNSQGFSSFFSGSSCSQKQCCNKSFIEVGFRLEVAIQTFLKANLGIYSLRFRLGVHKEMEWNDHKGMERNEMYLSKGKEQSGEIQNSQANSL